MFRKLLDRSDNRTNVDKHLHCDRFHVLRGHALTNNGLHTAEADAHLVLNQLNDRTYAAIREVDVVVEAVIATPLARCSMYDAAASISAWLSTP